MSEETQGAEELEIEDYPARRRTLRVAFVTETYPPEVNGVAMTLARLVQGLHVRDHDVQLVRPRQPAAPSGAVQARFHEVLLRGLPVPRYPHLRMGLPAKRALVRLWSLRRPDVIHIATEGPLGWSALQAGRHLKIPVTSDFRTNFHAYSEHYGAGWLRKPIVAYLRHFHNATQRTFVPTEALRQDLSAQGFDRLSVVARGVDTALFHPSRRDRSLRAAWGVDDDTLVVACVGRLAAEKNLELWLRCLEAIRSEGVQVRGLLVGDGPLRASLAARCPELIFAGQRSGTDLAAHYASADFFVFPSLTETFGNVVIEAMSSGLSVLAFDHAAAATLIRSGVNGRLAAPDDAGGFVSAARQAGRDRSALATWGGAARASVRAHDWGRVIEYFERELFQVLQPEADARQPGRSPAGIDRRRAG